jgi:hypothetical protein
MSRNSIIILSTAMLLATTATGAFAGSGRHVGGNSASAAGVASNLHHSQAVGGEAHRSTLATTRIKKDDPNPCREPDNCGATDQGGLDGSGVFKGVIKSDGLSKVTSTTPKAHDDGETYTKDPSPNAGLEDAPGATTDSGEAGRMQSGADGFLDSRGNPEVDGDFESGASDGTAAAVKGPSKPSTSNRPSSANLPHAGGNALSAIAQ